MSVNKSKITILGIPGSLRAGSFNMSALQTAVDLAPDDVVLKVFDRLGEFPLFDQDNEDRPPAVVSDFKQQIRRSDAILFATPEYNYSIPGVLKNAIDWASRPYGDSAWEGKPAAIMSASGGMLGGARAQYHLRQVFVFLNMQPLNRPEVIIPNVAEKINNDGRIGDRHTLDKIRQLVEALRQWTLELRTGRHYAAESEESRPYEKAYSRSGF